jgi:hypothetical protein
MTSIVAPASVSRSIVSSFPETISEPKKNSFIHIVKNQIQYDEMIQSYINSDDNTNHLVYIHAHGGGEPKQADVLKSIKSCTGANFIFISDLTRVMSEGIKQHKNMYILAVSCHWNKKYDPEFAGEYCLPKPTISLAPTEASRLPYPCRILEGEVKNLPNNFDETYMRTWFNNLKANFDYNLNCHEIYIAGELQKHGSYELIYSD